MKKTFDDARTEHWKHIENFENRKNLINEYTGGYPPCIKLIFKEGLPPGTRNNTIYLLARFLKKFKKEEEIYNQLIDLAYKSYSDSERQDIKQIRRTIDSALSRAGNFLSCTSLSPWCDKKQCDVFSKKQSVNLEKVFNIYSYQESLTLLKTAIQNGEFKRVLRTGIDKLDEKSKILQDSVIVIGSLSDAGKTSFAITLAKNNQDKKILHLAIEEGRDRTALRLYKSMISENVNVTIVTGKIGEITPDYIYHLVNRYSSKIDFIIIDQLVNLTEAAKEERLKYKRMMEKFREIAREFKKPIFVLHQLNRLAKFDKEKEPSKEHLAEGADIERQAYDIWLLYRRKHEGKYYNLLKIDKNKNYKSPIIIPLEYDFKTNTFRDYPHEFLDWVLFKKLGVDENEYYFGQVEEDIKI